MTTASSPADLLPVRLPAEPGPSVEEALATLAVGSRSFSFAARFLPADRREEAALLYAFCRYVDDLADEAPDPDQARMALEQVLVELEGGAPARPIVAEVRRILDAAGVPPTPAIHLVEGMLGDLEPFTVATDDDLVRYGYRVAGTVGLMMCGVLGVTQRSAWAHALDLGIGMQITNIVRDVREDAERGRVYLPASRLRRHGVEPTPEAVLAAPEAVRRVAADLVELADRYYRSADHGLRFIPWRARGAILVASRVYRAIGLRLLRLGGNPLEGRTVVPWYEKAWWALRAVARLPATRRWRQPHRAMLHRALGGLPGAAPEPHGAGATP